jgi:tetratricopeptide (TPR) repeat protein
MSDYNLVEEYFLKVEVLLGEGEFANGKKLLEEILDIEPGYGRAHNHLGWIYYAKFDDYRKAEYHYRLSIKFAPEYPAGYINMSFLLVELKRYEDARSNAYVALEVPAINRSVIYNELGRIEEMLGNYKMAIHNYNEAIRLTMHSNETVAYNANFERAKAKMRLYSRRFNLF